MLTRTINSFLLFVYGSILLVSCQTDSSLFSLLPSEKTGLVFNNEIVENDSINIISLEYVYNGGAVAVADFNNDGLTDIFFGGNRVSNKLFLNLGNLKFRDVSLESKIAESKKWHSGVAVVDINQDGLMDIYVCATISKDSLSRANILYVNQGLSKDGIPSFVDQATLYGIADTGHSSNAAFFDYDNDGDLDLYVLTNTIESNVPTSYRPKINDGSALNTDRLYRNNGDQSFTNVSKQAGIICEGYGLGLAIADINQDGWQDIYVSNDYVSNDLLYINNKNGTFSNNIDQYIRHQSQFSMGNDIADINNDGLLDIITLDMLPEGNLRRKTVINGASYTTYLNNKQYGYSYQYIRNMLQLNNGNGTFSEVGQMAGIHQTEWSWSPLFADFDNDGFKDLIITNGFPKDVTDKDFGNFRNGPAGATVDPILLSSYIPVVKVPNRAFKNMDGLTFSDVTERWGMNIPSFSNGAGFADFDNDGDLDYVVNNINDPPFFYENNLYKVDSKDNDSHYLRIKLIGDSTNKIGLGAKVVLKWSDGKIQYHDHSIYRGYISCVEDVVHFGLGRNLNVDTLIVCWPNKRFELLTNIKANQLIKLDYKNSIKLNRSTENIFVAEPVYKSYLQDVSEEGGIAGFKHEEEDRIDFNIQRTLPHKFSQAGPGISTGDVNGDGLDDFFIGGSVGHNGSFFMQCDSGKFQLRNNFINPSKNKMEEDEGSLFLDVDHDGDLDLYIVSGGFETEQDNLSYQDRLYKNDGSGYFELDTKALPPMRSSKSCVRAADFDRDGDLDLFVGSRVTPGRYPLPGNSYLLENQNGKFIDRTELLAPGLRTVGMVTDALWSDFDNDKAMDLIIVGEFMSIKFYRNVQNKLEIVKGTGVENLSGWWNSIVGGDFDEDGDTDYVVGNLGLNNYYNATEAQPLRVYAKDIDSNGSIDPILTCYFKSEEGFMKEYPVNFWDELNAQSPKFRRKFNTYHDYGLASINEVLTEPEREGSLILSATNMATSYLKNNGSGKFQMVALDKKAQVGPVNGLISEDFNTDGHLDILMVGNDYGNEVFGGRYDAFIGLMMLGDGDGNFSPLSSGKSGFFVPGDAKGLAKISGLHEDVFVATQNQAELKLFKGHSYAKARLFKPEALDAMLELHFVGGRKQKIELYYGSGYLSQSSRSIHIPEIVEEAIIYNYKGQSRKLVLKAQR